MQVVIFENEFGGVAVTIPINRKESIQEIAKKAVTIGKPYWIIEDYELPSNEFRNAWELDTDALGNPDGKGERLNNEN